MRPQAYGFFTGNKSQSSNVTVECSCQSTKRWTEVHPAFSSYLGFLLEPPENMDEVESLAAGADKRLMKIVSGVIELEQAMDNTGNETRHICYIAPARLGNLRLLVNGKRIETSRTSLEGEGAEYSCYLSMTTFAEYCYTRIEPAE